MMNGINDDSLASVDARWKQCLSLNKELSHMNTMLFKQAIENHHIFSVEEPYLNCCCCRCCDCFYLPWFEMEKKRETTGRHTLEVFSSLLNTYIKCKIFIELCNTFSSFFEEIVTLNVYDEFASNMIEMW